MEGLPHLTPVGLGIVLWLAVVNTAIAYLLYNHALQHMTALQMNLVLGLSPFVTALLAVPVLGEQLVAVQWAGMVVRNSRRGAGAERGQASQSPLGTSATGGGAIGRGRPPPPTSA